MRKRKERESNPQGSSLARFRAGCRRRSACPSESSSSGGRNRTRVLPVNSRALVPARTPPESLRCPVGMAGFEPAISCSQGRRIGQAFLHPESSRSPNKCPAGVEPARPPWRGGRLPLHHGHHRRPRIDKELRAPSGSRTHVAALRGRSLRRWTTSACIGMGPEGLEPSPNRLRAGRSAARTSVLTGVASRPGRSRTSAARLSAGCSPVELQAVAVLFSRWSAPGELNPSSLAYKASALAVELGAMGPEGFEPPPTGLKGRHAAATPRPRAGHFLPGYAFDPAHRLAPR